MHFEKPWFLLILLALPLLAVLARWSRSGLERGRSIAGTAVRTLLLLAVVFSLADAHWLSRSYRTCTIFLLDHSYSIPQEIQKKAFSWIDEQLRKHLPKDDIAGVIVFGDDAMIEVPPAEQPMLSGPHSLIGRAATDVGAAIRLALAVFPQGYQKRIVLVSDGNENKGHALPEAELARAQGASVDVFPLRYEYPAEAWMEGLHVPADILPREPFDVTAVVNSQREGEGKLAIYRNGELLSHQKVRLNKGKNVFTVKQKVENAGNFSYEAVIEMPGDTVTNNNAAHAFANARGEARIGIVAGEPVDAEELVKALKEEGLFPTVYSPADLARARFDTAAFDAIVFANVEALQVGQAGMQAVEAAVHDAGVGFVMIGGERSYGPGGYRGTPIEELLPVTMEQPQRRVIPNGALCLILHTCEIADGNYWAKQIGLAALNVLGSRDYMGVCIFGQLPGGNYDAGWLFPMQLCTDKGKLANLISGAQPGDMPDFDATMTIAHKGLRELNAASKHVVVISDADPSGPQVKLVDAMVADRITISTIAIFPHSGSDVDKMAAIAARAKGRFYNVTDPKKLPQIFIKEASTLQRSMIIEGNIPPLLVSRPDWMAGIGGEELPMLHGYTLTHPKPLSKTSIGAPIPKEQGAAVEGGAQLDALLVEWTYGLGKTVAWTSDAKNRWGRDWVAWPKYKKFWSQAVRSALRTVPRAPFSLQTEIEGGKGKVTIDAVDEQGRFLHTLQFAGSVTSPDGEKAGLAFRQVGPGRYEAQFDATAVGVYSITGSYEGPEGRKGYISQGIPLSYASEYRDLKSNESLLRQIQERTEGRILKVDDRVFEPLRRSAGVAMPLWPWLLMALLALFPIDVFIRRVAVDWGEFVRKRLAKLRRRRAPARPAEVPAAIAQLARVKQEVRAVKLAPASQPVELEAVPGAPKAAAPAAAAAPPAPKPAAPAETRREKEANAYLDRLLAAKKKSQGKD
jgi:uncharacterized membrane protein